MPAALVPAALVIALALLARTVGGVRRMRTRGAVTAALDHGLDLPGALPLRRVVVLGDSAAAGHGLPSADVGLARRLGRALHAADDRATAVRSVARDGAVTNDVLAEQLDAAVGGDVVVVGVGVNDAVKGRRLAVVEAELRELLQGLQTIAARSDAVVLITCPDLSAAPGVPPLLRGLLGARCRAVARRQQLVATALGVPTVTVDRATLTAEVFGVDGFHPGPVGHDRLAAAVLPFVPAG